jgi:hypothetical protein
MTNYGTWRLMTFSRQIMKVSVRYIDIIEFKEMSMASLTFKILVTYSIKLAIQELITRKLLVKLTHLASH